MMTRRRFVGTLGLAAAALGAGLGPELVRRRRLDAATLAGRAGALSGGRVLLRDAAGARHRAVVEDVSVVRRPGHGDAPAVEEVSLLLAADAPAGMYALEADDLRVDSLHYLPVDGPGPVRRLEAVVTRIV